MTTKPDLQKNLKGKNCSNHPERKAVDWDYTFNIPVCAECKEKYERMDNDSFDF